MRIVVSLTLVLVVSGTQAAPAPVFKPSKAPKTPYEVMLAELRKTGKATGSHSADGRTWTLTVEKIEGEQLSKVMLTCLDSTGRVLLTCNAPSARSAVKDEKSGQFVLVLYKVVFEGAGLDGSAGEKTLELFSKR